MEPIDPNEENSKNDTSNIDKPEGVRGPYWYIQRGYRWDFFFGRVFKRIVFTVNTPFIDFGYAWE